MQGRGETVYALVRLVRPMTLTSARVVERSLQDRGLTVGMRAVLEVVSETGPRTVPGIARALDVSRQATQRLVNELLEGGHVSATTNPAHRRSQLIGMTPQGTSAFESIRRQETEMLAALAPEISGPALDTALEVMRAVARDIRRNANAPTAIEEE